MYLLTDYHTPAYLTGYVRAALLDLPVNQFSLRRWLPTRPVADLEYRFNKGSGGLTPTAQYRAYDAESPIGRRRGTQRRTGELPPISEKIRFGEYERLKTQNNPDDEIRKLLLRDAVDRAKAIEARLEVARGAALVNSQVTIQENELTATIDFQRNPSNSANAAVWWTDPTADVVGELTGWVQYYIDTNGVPPGALLTSTRVRGLMLRNQGIRQLAQRGANTPAIANVDDLRTILDSYDLPAIETYDARFDSGGTPTRVIADNVAMLVPPPVDPTDWEGADLGGTFTGTAVESLEPEYGLEGDEPGIVVGQYKTPNPVAIWTNASAIAVPVVANPDLTVRLQVAP